MDQLNDQDCAITALNRELADTKAELAQLQQWRREQLRFVKALNGWLRELGGESDRCYHPRRILEDWSRDLATDLLQRLKDGAELEQLTKETVNGLLAFATLYRQACLDLIEAFAADCQDSGEPEDLEKAVMARAIAHALRTAMG
ncbi:MAG: hypothetical protein JO110_03855 [Acetobacteraceae bacterium]|nr:hypothetical protein [Acetobacteraceae bacterium]